MDKCLESAYDDLQLMISEIFIKVKSIPNQMSYENFAILFETYDWENIIDALEELDNYHVFNNDICLFNIIRSKIDVFEGPFLGSKWKNTYFLEYISE